MMKLLRRILGFESPYSWTKWLRMGFLAAALYIAYTLSSSFGPSLFGSGIIGFIIGLVVYLIFFGPLIAVTLGIAVLIGAVIGGVQSGRKQAKSLKESKATGDAEIYELDKLRMKVQLVNLLFKVFAVVCFAGAAVWSFYLNESYGDNKFILYIPYAAAFIVIAGAWLMKAPLNRRYKESFRETVVVKGLEAVLTNMDFKPEETLGEEIIKASGLFSGYDIYTGNDRLTAEYKGIRFTQSDALLREEHEETYLDKDGDLRTRTTYTTVFNGTFMLFDYDALSNEPVFVLPRGTGKPSANANEILTELDSFNQNFSVTAENAASAFRILTPPVLEGISLARDKLGCPFALSFKDDKIYAAVFNGDSFEAQAHGDATLSEQRERVVRDIKAMLDMVETLYLKK